LSSDLVSMVEDKLSRDISSVDELLSVKDSVREETIKFVREIIRASGEAIRRIHLGEYEKAWENLVKASEYVNKVKTLLEKHPDLYYSGLVYNGFSEYVEARVTYSLVVEKKMPSLEELGVPYIPYLQGLGDTIGELRRYILILLDKGLLEEASTYLEVMEHIYLWLRKLNYPDPLTPGLRHKVDVARRLIEDTRTLYISTRNSLKLSKQIAELTERLKGNSD